MLVIISDLHLTDGTSGETIKAGAFRVFRERLRDLAYDASWRADGKYKPIEELHLILLGDILDVIRSSKWLAAKTPRPWDNPQQQQFAQKVRTITNAILKQNGDSLGTLKSLDDGKTITIPPATKAGRPVTVPREPEHKERVPVRVNLHYMVGNHDWFYHLPGPAYTSLRRTVVEAMGLANSPAEPFPHEPEESPSIVQVFEEHKVYARHGDIYDSFNYEGDRDASSLGDAIVIELLNRFPTAVEKALGRELPGECVTGLREIDNVRLLTRTCPDPHLRKRVKKIWDDLADEFLALKFVRDRDSFVDLLDNVDRLEWALKFSRGVSIHTVSRVLTWVQERIRGSADPFYRNAFSERAFKKRTARFIVYGHTHHHEVIPLDSSYVGGRLFDQMCLNSGTWRRVHEQARLNPGEQEFMGYHVMTYLAFFRNGERRGRPFEAWSGALGV
jgi:UDP-2,3-diacylglucosamine pyrophosphatase LpxH